MENREKMIKKLTKKQKVLFNESLDNVLDLAISLADLTKVCGALSQEELYCIVDDMRDTATKCFVELALLMQKRGL